MWQLMSQSEHAVCLHRFYVVCLSLMQGRYVWPYWADSHFPAVSSAASTTQAKSLPLCSFSCGVHTAFVITPNSSSPSLPHWLICQSLTTVASFPLSPLFFFFLESPPPLFPPFRPPTVALSFWLSISVPSSPSSAHSSVLHFFSLFPFFPLLSVSFPLFSSAASVFLCVNSWDAFVEGFP